ncbi:50S ribosomal protein L3 [Patescibacteria group bacterium]|nr:50S ribosomal protein L3 [Patescibacteria group bacterium]
MKAIIGKKVEMTQIFTPEGVVLPVTKIKAEPVTVTQIKTNEKDGYAAVQVASGSKKATTKPLLGHFKGVKYRYAKEFKIEQEAVKVGDTWGVDIFNEGEKVRVIGTSKGKGFQGVVKRWGFHGSPASHGHKDQLRMPGSIGATGPARVFKGMRMGGHMGNAQITSKWLEVIKVDLEDNCIYVKGSVPGARNGILYIMTETKFELPKKEVKKEEAPKEETPEEKVEEKKEEVKEEVPKEEVKEETKAEEVKKEDK